MRHSVGSRTIGLRRQYIAADDPQPDRGTRLEIRASDDLSYREELIGRIVADDVTLDVVVGRMHGERERAAACENDPGRVPLRERLEIERGVFEERLPPGAFGRGGWFFLRVLRCAQ